MFKYSNMEKAFEYLDVFRMFIAIPNENTNDWNYVKKDYTYSDSQDPIQGYVII